MDTSGPQWSIVLGLSRTPRQVPKPSVVPLSVGVYVWFHEDAPVYIGEAEGSSGLRGRLSTHFNNSPDMSRSTLRASVAVAQLGLDRKIARSRPSHTQEQPIRRGRWSRRWSCDSSHWSDSQ